MQVVWDVTKGEALCGAPIQATDVRCFHSDAQRFATCGSDSTLYMWQHDAATHKLTRSDIQVLLCHKNARGWMCAVLADKGGGLLWQQESTYSVCWLGLMQGVCLQLGQYKRNFTRLQVAEDDKSLFVGSTSGDVAQASQPCTVHIAFTIKNAAITQAYADLNATH